MSCLSFGVFWSFYTFKTLQFSSLSRFFVFFWFLWFFWFLLWFWKPSSSTDSIIDAFSCSSTPNIFPPWMNKTISDLLGRLLENLTFVIICVTLILITETCLPLKWFGRVGWVNLGFITYPFICKTIVWCPWFPTQSHCYRKSEIFY